MVTLPHILLTLPRHEDQGLNLAHRDVVLHAVHAAPRLSALGGLHLALA